jgi:hypothetical protein
MNFEKKLSKDDREIYICLKPFARFLSKDEFEELFNGLILEKNLKQRMNQLVSFQQLGLKTFEEIENYLDTDGRRNKESRKSNVFYENGSTTLKLSKEIKNTNEDLSNTEKDFIKRMSIPVQVYLEIKNKLHCESKASLKNIISQSKHVFNKDEADEIASFIVKIKKV